MNYENDIRIDENSLDIEWLEQASLMFKYVQHASQVRKELDQAKEKLDFVKAELDKKIRTNPDAYGIAKITEGAITAAILADGEYKETSAELIDMQFEHNVAQGAVRAVECRKDALENLVRLHGQSYFAGPRVPRDLADERRMKQQKSNAAVGKMTRTKLSRDE